MKVQKIKILENETVKTSWVVLDNNYLPVEPLNQFLRYLGNCGCSPLTERTYAYHLCGFFRFLNEKGRNWQHINFETLIEFILSLKQQAKPLGESNGNVISFPTLQPKIAERSPATINAKVAAVVSFYDFMATRGIVQPLAIYSGTDYKNKKHYKSFLHGIVREKDNSGRNKLKLRTVKRRPKTISEEDLEKLLSACSRKRDVFLVCLLFECGLRIGQALGLRHEDVRSFDNEVIVVPRSNNVNGARAKTRETYTVHASKELMSLYTAYLLDEFGDIESDYVFVNLWEKPLGKPMSYSAVFDLFARLSKKSGVQVNPHMLRHTHASNLFRADWQPAYVSKRLGHRSVQTTLDIYTHVTNDDMKRIHQKYLEDKEK